MILDVDRLHERIRPGRGQGVSTRVLVDVLQRFDFDRSSIIVVARDERRARELRIDAALVAEALGLCTTPGAASLRYWLSRDASPRALLYVHEAWRLAERLGVEFMGWDSWLRAFRGSRRVVAFDPPGMALMWEANEDMQLTELSMPREDGDGGYRVRVGWGLSPSLGNC